MFFEKRMRLVLGVVLVLVVILGVSLGSALAQETKRILLTGYGPFAYVEENVTEKIVRTIEKDWNYEEVTLKILVMPVEWVKVKELLEDTVISYEPNIIISMGHAESYKAITLEARYFNEAAGPDNKGEIRFGGIIRLDGEVSYQSNFPLEELKNYLKENGIPTVIHDGLDGMTYLCNFAGYNVAYLCSKNTSKKVYYLFVHVPSPEDLDFDISLKGIRMIIDFAINLIDSH